MLSGVWIIHICDGPLKVAPLNFICQSEIKYLFRDRFGDPAPWSTAYGTEFKNGCR